MFSSLWIRGYFVTGKHALNEVPGMGEFAFFSKRNMLYSLVLQYV